MEMVVERDNVDEALKRVRQNKGSPGTDGMTVEELPKWLAQNWEAIRAMLLDGTYQPKPVREVEIPKSDGGIRKLGIPTVLDRLIQQCVLQVLQPPFDPTFSQHSYGFRPGRSAHQALEAAARYIREGRRWVVDVDLEKFFDRVNHDVLMGRLAKRIGDKRVLRLIRGYLNAGIMVDGVVMARESGTPQGGPLSPLLANVLLDEVDKELEKRGHAFARYADDCNVYVGSRKAGERVFAALKQSFEKLRLRINESKSGVAVVTERKFLGHSFVLTPEGEVHFVVAPKALEALKQKVRALTARSGGKSMRTVIADLSRYQRGWRQYFRLVRGDHFNSLDGWIRRRLRALQLKQWKTPQAIARAFRQRGVHGWDGQAVNAHRRRYWAMARHPGMNKALSTQELHRMGLRSLAT
jgi:group II intron reverse transcriptase/maturase